MVPNDQADQVVSFAKANRQSRRNCLFSDRISPPYNERNPPDERTGVNLKGGKNEEGRLRSFARRNHA